MPLPLARAELESLLRDRKLVPPVALGTATDEYAMAPTGVTALDAALGTPDAAAAPGSPLSGGFPRGQLSEIVGARSSGRTSVLLQMLAAATARHEIVALIDALDMFDVASAAAAGVDFDRLLWIRGQVSIHPGPCRDMNQRALDRAIKALTLVLQAGNFGLVAFDAAEAPPHVLERLPFTTWRRLQRIIEGSQTACVLVGGTPIARSAGGITVRLTRAGGAGGAGRGEAPAQLEKSGGVRVDGRLFRGLEIEIDVIRPHARIQHDVRVPLSTTCD